MKSRKVSFEEHWREVRPGLERALLARGAAPDVVDDVLQETSIRLLKVWERVDHERPLAPFARQIAFNYLIDLHRASRAIPVEEVPDQPSGYDLEEHALARARLARAEVALDSLTASDRSALLAEVGVGERGTTSASKMARLRARKRLLAAMDRVAAAFGGIQLGWRRAALWLQEFKPIGEPLMPVAAGVASVVTVAVLGLSADPVAVAAPRRQQVERTAAVALKDTHHRDARKLRVTPMRKSIDREASPTTEAEPRAPKPQPSPTESTVVDTGPAKAKTGKNYKGVAVCTGEDTPAKEDDHSASINVDTGDDDDEGTSCD